MKKQKTCFISYSQIDEKFVKITLLPILKEAGYIYNFDYEGLKKKNSLFEYLAIKIKECDLFVSVYRKQNAYCNFESGVAIGNNKPTLTLVEQDNHQHFPDDLKFTNYLFFNKDKPAQFTRQFKGLISGMFEEVMDSASYSLSMREERKIFAIRAGTITSDYSLELQFTSELIDFLKKITPNSKIEVTDVSKGSLKSLLSIDLKSYAELIEKILFFIPELKKRNLQNFKIEAEVQRMIIENNQLETNHTMKQANDFADLLKKYQDLGIALQVDNELVISQDNFGFLSFTQPKMLK